MNLSEKAPVTQNSRQHFTQVKVPKGNNPTSLLALKASDYTRHFINCITPRIPQYNACMLRPFFGLTWISQDQDLKSNTSPARLSSTSDTLILLNTRL